MIFRPFMAAVDVAAKSFNKGHMWAYHHASVAQVRACAVDDEFVTPTNVIFFGWGFRSQPASPSSSTDNPHFFPWRHAALLHLVVRVISIHQPCIQP
jgi:hypothetical protein